MTDANKAMKAAASKHSAEINERRRGIPRDDDPAIIKPPEPKPGICGDEREMMGKKFRCCLDPHDENVNHYDYLKQATWTHDGVLSL